MAKLKRVLSEIAKREKIKAEEAKAPKFILEELCFPKQLAFIKDPAKYKTAVCSRRAGKTEACAHDLVATALEFPGVNVLYITLSRVTAKRIIWKNLIQLNKKYNLKGKPNNQELSITLPNNSTIYLSGAKDESEIEKFRGMALKKVYIDESQSFRAYIKALIDDVITPALIDYDGSLCLIGTPGPVAAGYFYECSTNPNWSNHHWTMLDNPYLEQKSGKKVELILLEERKRRGITEKDATYQRENLGLWVNDLNSLVYKFSKQTNIFTELPAASYEYIFGVDIGWNDADAIAVLAYDENSHNVYLVEEIITRKQNISELVTQIKYLQEKYRPIKMVMDAGALGKKIQEEIRSRHGLPLEAAQKERKHEFISLLNDDLRTGKLKTFPNSRFEQDAELVQWDYTNPAKPKISDSYHTDIGDAVLYAWRECKHYLSQPKKQKITDPNLAMQIYWEKEDAKFMKKREDESWERGLSDSELDMLEFSDD
ncbi:MAG: hypothetical protein FMNOHCHN_03727 [Ignavibacteriaceae bacterium]|nr:hypothetical protein [Ignavibacteriaceae bacterium]